ncbi:MAG: tail fiber domain-containing protein [Bacteroidales bacterium]|nr:tail fiber domain-containing protein [Bacteroidales bacterium]
MKQKFLLFNLFFGIILNAFSQSIWLNVDDYGAVGNGNTDDSQIINKVLNKCNGIVCLSSGKTYLINSTLIINDNKYLYIPSGTILLYSGPDNTPAITINRGGTLEGYGKLKSNNGIINNKHYGLLISSSESKVDFGTIFGFKYGVYLWGNGQGCAYNNIKIREIQKCVQAVKLYASNKGWVNQNYIHIDRVHMWTGYYNYPFWLNTYGIHMDYDSTTTHIPNANRFSGSIENVNTGIRLCGKWNRLDGLRLELPTERKVEIDKVAGSNWWFGELDKIDWDKNIIGNKNRRALQTFGVDGLSIFNQYGLETRGVIKLNGIHPTSPPKKNWKIYHNAYSNADYGLYFNYNNKNKLRITDDGEDRGTFMFTGFIKLNGFNANDVPDNYWTIYHNAGGNSDYGLIFKDNNKRYLTLRNSCVGIGENAGSPAYTLHVAGNSYCTSGQWIGSDLKLKKNIRSINNAMKMVNTLEGKRYELKSAYTKNTFVNNYTYGLIANEVKELIPELVSYDSISDLLALNYDGFIPILIEAIKEQQNEIEELKIEISKINQELESFKDINTATDIKDNSKIELKQNVPNPFNKNTIIDVFIPNDIKSAMLIICDLRGTQIQNYEITLRGNTSITIYGYTLNTGMYLYSLIANNKLVDTKQMILTE